MTGQHTPDPREAVVAEALAQHRVNYHHRNVGPEPVTAENLRYTSCEGCDWLGGHSDEAGWEAHVTIAVLAALDATATDPDTADPADGLSELAEALHAEHLRDFPRVAEALAGLVDEPSAAECGNCQRWAKYALAARQRPTRQADTDRAVVEAVEALADKFAATTWHHSGENVAISIRTAIAAASEPTSGHHHDQAGTSS